MNADAAQAESKNGLAGLIRRHRGLLLFVLLMVVFRSSFADWNQVPTTSMVPTIVAGDRIVVNKLAYDLKLPLTDISILRLGEPRRGDIVVFDSQAADTRLVKRVIGLPGETVALLDNRLVIDGIAASYGDIERTANGRSAIETYEGFSHSVMFSPTDGRLAYFGPVTVPPDHYLMLGDNRDNSADSRVYGFVPRAEIVGRSAAVAFSVDYDRYYLPRADRFLRALQ